jgi:hypothetical protein
MKMFLAMSLLLSSLSLFASDKDFPPGCLTGSDNSKVVLVVLDNYTSQRGTSAEIEALKAKIKSNKEVSLTVQSLQKLGISEEDSISILNDIQSVDNSN